MLFTSNTLLALILAAVSSSAVTIRSPASPQAGAAVVARRQTTREEIMRRQALGPARRQTSAVPYSACSWNTGPTDGEINAYFENTNFNLAVGSTTVSTSNTANSNSCTELLDYTTDGVVAYYANTECDVYNSWQMNDLYYESGANTILPNEDCTTAVASYGLPSGGYCCHMYTALT